MEERRNYVRIPDSSQISYKIVPIGAKSECVTKDISQDGLKFLVHQFIPKNSFLKIRFALNKTSITFEGIVKVMWIKELPYSLNYEVGVQFVDIPQEAAGHLIDYIKVFLHDKK